MKPLYKGVLLAFIHLALVASLGAKMLYDRATRPRVWVRTAPVDPELPIRGRYVSLRLELPAENIAQPQQNYPLPRVNLEIKNGLLVAAPVEPGRPESESFEVRLRIVDGEPVADLREPVAFFLPEHAKDPSQRKPDEQLWVEVTVPKKGPPRPIRLGVKKEAVIAPLELR